MSLLSDESFAVASEHMYEFVFDTFLDERSCGSKILAGIEVGGVFDEVLSDCGGKGKTQFGVDVDLSDGH